MRHLASVLLLSLLLPSSAHAGWRALYPVFGGSVPLIRVDAGSTLYAAASGGLFKSTNRGATWSTALGDLPTTSVTAVAPDPVQVGTVYAGTDMGLFRTTDGGTTWTRLPLNLPGGVTISQIAIAPADTNRIFISTWGSYVWRSLDHGATWTQSASGLSGGWSGPAFTTSMAVDPTNANRVYTSTWRGRLFRSDDAAATWTAIADGGTWASSQIHVARSNPAVLYTLHDEYWFGRGTVLRSADYGDTWTSTARPATRASDAVQLEIDPANENIVYAGTSEGLHRSTNGGATWTLVLHPSGPTAVNAIAIEPGTSSYVYAGSGFSGFYRSFDSGANWQQSNTGLAAASFVGLDISRGTPSTIYAGAQGSGYVKSTDAGMSWSPVGTAEGLQDHILIGLAVHPQNASTAVATTFDGTTSRVWRTSDGGASFAAVASGYYPGPLAFNPLAPAYVHGSLADWQGGFFRSTDGGMSWSIPYWWYVYPTTYAFHPTLPNILLTGAFQYTGAALNTLHVAWSNDNGTNWTSLSGFGQGDVSDLALDANSPSTLYLAGRIPTEGTQGVYKFNVNYSGGTIASISRVAGTFNNGLTNPAVRRLAYDKANGLLYASTPNGLFRSSDRAATWTSINDGLPYPSADWMTITPDGRSVYVATSGGIWEYSDTLPVPVARPLLTTSPSALLQQAVSGRTTTMQVSATSTTAADTITLAATSPLALTFTATSGNPATGTLSFAPGANLRGQTFPVTLTAQSTLDPSQSATITRYLSIVGDTATDVSALISNSSGGSINTPDGQFSLDLAAGAIQATGVSTVSAIDVANKPDVCLQLAAAKKTCAKAIASYDLTVDNLLHYSFNTPVALTFAFGPDVVTSLADLEVAVYNEATGIFEPRNDTSCLAAFGRVPFTGTPATGGTISVCTSTVSLWALVDTSKLTPADSEPPVITITTPPEGASYLLNQPDVVAVFRCDDAGSGVATCNGGPAIDPSRVGAKTFTVNAADAAGNTASKTRAYTVNYAFSGFLPPLGAPSSVNAARAGSTIPLKWQLRDAAGVFITSVASVRSLASAPIACDATPAPFTGGDPALTAGGKPVRYDPLDHQFVFDWHTPKSWTGCRALQLTLDDGRRWLAKFAFQ